MGETKQIGLPPPKDAQAPAPPPGAMGKARLLNLIGLVTPAANLGLFVVAKPSRRWFGVGAVVACALLFGVSRWKQVEWLGRTAVCVHVALVLVGIANPLWVEKIGDAWAAFGTLLGKVMMYPIFTIVYYLAVTPTALLMRALGKDPLGAKKRGADTYWTPHEPPSPDKYERQF